MNIFNFFKQVSASFLLVFIFSIQANALVIGHFSETRTDRGLGGDYLSEAKQWLQDQGHVLVETNIANQSFLDGVDAFYTGLPLFYSFSETPALVNFVENQGGFLFLQTDHAQFRWHGAAGTLLANWGISTTGLYQNNTGHQAVGSHPIVTSPNDIDMVDGVVHSEINNAPNDFEVLVQDSLGRDVLGLLDLGTFESSDVLVSTDINFWTEWHNESNRQLWENIWAFADNQITGKVIPGTGGNGGVTMVAEPSNFALFLIGLAALVWRRQAQR